MTNKGNNAVRTLFNPELFTDAVISGAEMLLTMIGKRYGPREDWEAAYIWCQTSRKDFEKLGPQCRVMAQEMIDKLKLLLPTCFVNFRVAPQSEEMERRYKLEEPSWALVIKLKPGLFFKPKPSPYAMPYNLSEPKPEGGDKTDA